MSHYGPHAAQVRAIIARVERLTPDEDRALEDAWYATSEEHPWIELAALVRSSEAGLSAMADASVAARLAGLSDGAVAAAGDAAGAVAAQDLLTAEQRDLMTGPWRQAIPDQAVRS